MNANKIKMSRLRTIREAAIALLLAGVIISLTGMQAAADPHLGQSVNVAIIGSPGVINGGSLPTAGPVGELGDFTFTNLAPGAVNAANLAAYDTVVLNVASPEMACTTGTLSAAAKTDLVNFVGSGKKLIIYDSECAAGVGVDYSWLPFPFTTSNPGALGATGTLTIVEDNTLSHNSAADPHFIDAPNLGSQTDAVGDMNVMTTIDPNWCLDMSGTNIQGVTGPVHTYARFGSVGNVGLMIYNGLDVDFMGFEPTPPAPNGLRKIWVQELQQPFNPDNLPCKVPVVGIVLDPPQAENPAGTSHTVTATVTDFLGNPAPGVLVSFEVTSGPNIGEVSDPNTGECTANNDCTTDANGQVSWTYTSNGAIGTDTIIASFATNGEVVPSKEVIKNWIDRTPPECDCVETVNPAGKNVPPAGSTTLPGAKGGQNEDGFYELKAKDNVDPNPQIFVVDTGSGTQFGPFTSGTKIKYTEANGATPNQKEIGGPNSAVAWHITGTGDAAVFAVDAAGNKSPLVDCLVPPPPK